MLPADQSDRLHQVQETLNNLRIFDVSTRFVKEYTDKNFKPRIHAELLLLAHFYHRDLEFVNKDRYIGCSKPSCYCCDLYIRCHPGNFVVRPSHGNLWMNWRAPVPPLDDDKAAQKHTAKVLNDMVKYVRRDVLFQIESKQPRRSRVPDSTTGISTSVAGSWIIVEKTLNSVSIYKCITFPAAVIDVSARPTASSLSSSSCQFTRSRGWRAADFFRNSLAELIEKRTRIDKDR